jgi:hypothetical protein
VVLATAESTVFGGGPTNDAVTELRPPTPLAGASLKPPGATLSPVGAAPAQASSGVGTWLAWLAAVALASLPEAAVAKRATRVALSVLVAAIVSEALRDVLQTTYTYWGPITCAFISGGPEGGILRISAMRLQGTLLGATYGYMAVK